VLLQGKAELTALQQCLSTLVQQMCWWMLRSHSLEGAQTTF